MPFVRQQHVALGLIPPGEGEEAPIAPSIPVRTVLAPEMTEEAPEAVLEPSSPKELCLRMVDEGKPITSISQITGIARGTIHGWIRQRIRGSQPAFQVAVPRFLPPTGIQTIVSEEIYAQIRSDLAAGLSKNETARRAGVAQSTLRGWIKRNIV